MDTKNKTNPKQGTKPVATVREGAIGASIFVAQSPDGNQSHYFTMSRCWKNQTSGQFKYTDRMYPRNAEAVAKVAEMAAQKCSELDAGIDQDASAMTSPTTLEPRASEQAAL
ncbi:hypothetical protein NG895_02425 [Aeoliella sp. ICT_H6.2]|uniref:Uncharacterized protein n=1 Tax=Aeoliella straminimaris TaxID=2954799 RepID=A0A9X2F6U6_9BACT|nr:hypothetical protein [Aeoliella straminimaris]MCO6042753.1 hypothetical protein [Aeoliella straminimaris]